MLIFNHFVADCCLSLYSATFSPPSSSYPTTSPIVILLAITNGSTILKGELKVVEPPSLVL
jgi:hypothetical protein